MYEKALKISETSCAYAAWYTWFYNWEIKVAIRN